MLFSEQNVRLAEGSTDRECPSTSPTLPRGNTQVLEVMVVCSSLCYETEDCSMVSPVVELPLSSTGMLYYTRTPP